ncbi:hypothetical protein NR511_18265 [Stenotrophomonas maltophilia]|uniref:hypothetical protein n=2 Tax=Stenotrophomonas maltophilia TaxID=40324 RepID=UPI0011105B28|nr:hypothetical protein [Stenotrophomonas maltophilia]MCF3474352.1 hypothetical protein [Stenotrophomonas maltophilia]MCF3506697.1 hypothetical protein [Stenotrophomonas maltophilia]MCR1537396.1 hypothetical protein [Stenotrophomonas maltophilia]TIK64093.1 hypothetical protein E4418_18900 [Stenotrophomonas maltophilia]TIK69698.1 hypothetical protein E4416_16870 [Stenotrophomonas maltophilia]
MQRVATDKDALDAMKAVKDVSGGAIADNGDYMHMRKKILNWLGLLLFALVFLRSSSYLVLKVYAIGHLERGDYFVMLPVALGSLLICGMFMAIVIKGMKSDQ